MRLDKFLANMGIGTRSKVKKAIGYGKVQVNDEIIKKSDYKIDEEKDIIKAYGKVVGYKEYVYFMLNKPAGVVTATDDNKDKTVLDLIQHKRKKSLFPVGRLDKDTEGLLILTNDGQLSHRLLSPKKHVDKIYYAKIKGLVTREHVSQFKEGIILEDGYQTMPAELEILSASDESEIRITIREGKYHQIKRMFEAVGCKVNYLQRIQMGGLKLDKDLKLGRYRELTEEELALLERR